MSRATEQALDSGSLQPVPTTSTFLDDGGVRFLVRIVDNLRRKKPAPTLDEPSRRSPFLPPYDPDLFVADLSPTHVCMLNKFNVVEHHALIVTREYVDQDTLLDRRDFEALWRCLAERDALGFYNGGKVAGASQTHKHLQLIPLPMAQEGPRIPVEPLLSREGVPFVHRIAWLDPVDVASDRIAEIAESLYLRMLGECGIIESPEETTARPYNLLVTRQWMLVVPRRCGAFATISVNSLGFAGAMLVRDADERNTLKEAGPMTVLCAVAASFREEP